jgi:hypothetical protein
VAAPIAHNPAATAGSGPSIRAAAAAMAEAAPNTANAMANVRRIPESSFLRRKRAGQG